MNDLIKMECKKISYDSARDYLCAIADVEKRLKAMKQAIKSLENFDHKANTLRAIAEYIVSRNK